MLFLPTLIPFLLLALLESRDAPSDAVCPPFSLGLHDGWLLRRCRQLLERARGQDVDVFDRAVDVSISRLRRKLDDGSGLELIHTLRGEGYRFDARVERR